MLNDVNVKQETWQELQEFIATGSNRCYTRKLRSYAQKKRRRGGDSSKSERPFRGIYAGFRGDMKFFVQLNPQDKASYTSENARSGCGASFRNPETACTDVRPDAGWVRTVRSTPQPGQLPPLAAALGWSFLSYFVDLLHVVYLGVARDAVGSFIADLVEFCSETLESLFDDLLQFCQCHNLHCGMTGLTWADLGIEDSLSFPHFSGKGYTCKVACTWLAAKLQKYENLQEQAACCWGLVEFQRICDSAGPFLSDAQATAAADAVQTYLTYFAKLAADNAAKHRCAYKFRPKTHSFAHHVVFRLKNGGRLNPRVTSCWQDESYIGFVCKIARGTHPATVALRTLQRVYMELNRRLCLRDAANPP